MAALKVIRLADLFHHAWALPVVASLHHARGHKLISLCHHLSVTRRTAKVTLNFLARLGLVMRNPGYGHPMRPEYLLTARGIRVAPACDLLLSHLESHDFARTGLKKWSMPVLAQLADGARFSEIKSALEPITDRALALALRDLEDAGLISRLVLDTRPPSVLYQPSRSADDLLEALHDLAARLNDRPRDGVTLDRRIARERSA
jgi:DNA-binding HxlR family transcriptional regulator